MNAANALWLDESTGADAPRSGSPVPASGLRAVEPSVAPSSAAPRSDRRSQLETLPCAGVVAAMEEPAELPSPSVRERHQLSWCVDFGDEMRTMSTFDLWTAIERGEVSADLRVWREGMECWMPVARVPSLAVALVSLAPLTTPSPTPAAATTGPAPEVRERPVGRPVPAPQLDAAPPPPQRRPARSWATTFLSPGTLWMALGSGVAAGAITAALMMSSRPAPLPAPAPHAPVLLAAPAEPPPVDPYLASLGALPPPVTETPAVEPPAAAPEAPRARHDELGQHRLRRGKKPPHAR